MTRQGSALVIVLFVFAFLNFPASAQVGITIRPVLQTTTTFTGQPLRFPLFRNQVTAILGELEPGGQVGRHQHPVPLITYVLEGTLTVEIEGQAPRVFPAGQAYAEVINTTHNAYNRGTVPVKVLTVAFGEIGTPILTRSSDSTPVGFRTTTILETTKTFTGEPILFPALANQFDVRLAELAPGAAIPRHVHPHTGFAYVLEGVFTNEPDGRQPQMFNSGGAWVETTIPHVGGNRAKTPGKVFGVFVGQSGVPVLIVLP